MTRETVSSNLSASGERSAQKVSRNQSLECHKGDTSSFLLPPLYQAGGRIMDHQLAAPTRARVSPLHSARRYRRGQGWGRPKEAACPCVGKSTRDQLVTGLLNC
jgi:hypothetical protein